MNSTALPSGRNVSAHVFARVRTCSHVFARWECAAFGPGESAEFPILGCQLDVAEIYRDPLARA
jgi:hypothetical protein